MWNKLLAAFVYGKSSRLLCMERLPEWTHELLVCLLHRLCGHGYAMDTRSLWALLLWVHLWVQRLINSLLALWRVTESTQILFMFHSLNSVKVHKNTSQLSLSALEFAILLSINLCIRLTLKTSTKCKSWCYSFNFYSRNYKWLIQLKK